MKIEDNRYWLIIGIVYAISIFKAIAMQDVLMLSLGDLFYSEKQHVNITGKVTVKAILILNYKLLLFKKARI